MATVRYVALLRGINVGGKNVISMADLRDAFEVAGHAGVRTYIQSGNVLFESSLAAKELSVQVEHLLASRFGAPISVVLRSHAQLRTVVAKAPPGFGEEPGRFHSDVIFLKPPLTAAKAMRVVTLRDGVDAAWPGTGVIYFTRLSERLSQSRMSRIVSTPEYQQMTIRTWTTVTKLLAMFDA